MSHSARLAEGVVDVAEQMAPDVLIRPAGGIGGRIGTSFELVLEVTEGLLGTPGVEGVVVLTDLGSATLTAEAVLETVDDPRAVLADGPLVEGAVAAAVAAQTGGSLTAVRRAVLGACGPTAGPAVAPGAPGAAGRPAAGAGLAGAPDSPLAGTRERVLLLRNRLGLHARPAAMLAREAAAHDALVMLNEVPAASVLELMALGLPAGAEIRLRAAGPAAGEALAAIERLVLDGFGED